MNFKVAADGYAVLTRNIRRFNFLEILKTSIFNAISTAAEFTMDDFRGRRVSNIFID